MKVWLFKVLTSGQGVALELLLDDLLHRPLDQRFHPCSDEPLHRYRLLHSERRVVKGRDVRLFEIDRMRQSGPGIGSVSLATVGINKPAGSEFIESTSLLYDVASRHVLVEHHREGVTSHYVGRYFSEVPKADTTGYFLRRSFDTETYDRLSAGELVELTFSVNFEAALKDDSIVSQKSLAQMIGQLSQGNAVNGTMSFKAGRKRGNFLRKAVMMPWVDALLEARDTSPKAVRSIRTRIIDAEGESELVNLIRSAYTKEFALLPDAKDGRLPRASRFTCLLTALEQWCSEGVVT